MSKHQLLSAMTGPNTYITLPSGQRGILLSVQREDGSGRCFNVTVTMSGKDHTEFVRTTD